MASNHTTIPVSKRTHELVRKQKRAGESYDDLLKKMVHQYEPEEVSH
ncbi:hypothetical protein [Haloarcula marina]|nr:hypothetical protein [Halomicroarcula marina]